MRGTPARGAPPRCPGLGGQPRGQKLWGDGVMGCHGRAARGWLVPRVSPQSPSSQWVWGLRGKEMGGVTVVWLPFGMDWEVGGVQGPRAVFEAQFPGLSPGRAAWPSVQLQLTALKASALVPGRRPVPGAGTGTPEPCVLGPAAGQGSPRVAGRHGYVVRHLSFLWERREAHTPSAWAAWMHPYLPEHAGDGDRVGSCWEAVERTSPF